MLRKSELEDSLGLEEEIGHRRRVGHFGLDAHHSIGPQVHGGKENSGTTRNGRPLQPLRLGSFQEIEGPGGHITYKRLEAQVEK